MPKCELTLRNQTTGNSLTWGETSPQDPQFKTVQPNQIGQMTIDEVPRGGVYVLACNPGPPGSGGGFTWSETHQCSEGSDNVRIYEINIMNGSPHVNPYTETQAGNEFTARIYNNSGADRHCFLVCGNQYKNQSVPLTEPGDPPTEVTIDTTGDVKIILFDSLFGWTQFPFVDTYEPLAITANSGATPAVQYEPFPLPGTIKAWSKSFTSFPGGDGPNWQKGFCVRYAYAVEYVSGQLSPMSPWAGIATGQGESSPDGYITSQDGFLGKLELPALPQLPVKGTAYRVYRQFEGQALEDITSGGTFNPPNFFIDGSK